MDLKDIQKYEDIELLVSKFYDKLLDDPITKDKFTHLDVKDKPGYKGNVFDRHSHLNLQPAHFKRWVEFWVSTVNEMFKGPRAEQAVHRAMLLSYTFQSKMHGNDENKIL